jgi:Tfp pilus assembly protein PilF
LLLAALADPADVQYLITGQGLADLGEWELAKMAFQHSLQLAPGYAEAWAFLSEARQKINPPEPAAALEDLQHALTLDPESISAITMLALYWQRQGQTQRASDLFRTAANLEPKDPAWYAALGSLAGSQGKLTDAEWYYRFAVIGSTAISLLRFIGQFLHHQPDPGHGKGPSCGFQSRGN